MATNVNLPLDGYSKVLVDVAGGGITYYGVSNKDLVATSEEEFAVLREQVVGSVTTYSWAAHDANSGPEQKYAWDDRATLTY